MRRRALLASLPALAALSGCNSHFSGRPAGGDEPTATTTQHDSTTPETTTTRPTETGTTDTTETDTTETTETATTTVRDPDYPRVVELASIDGTDYPGLEFDVALLDGRIDAAQTASLSATLENTGDATLELEMGYRPPFSKVRCEDGGYLLVKPEEPGELDACWEPPRPVGEQQILTKPKLEPSESLTTSMRVVGDPRTDACLPTGEFRFVSDFVVSRNGETEGRANAFTVHVTAD